MASVPFGRRLTGTGRRLAAAGALTAVLVAAGCGFDVQTTQPYQPAEGVNADVGQYQTQPAVKVRNLMILSRTEGQGFLSATLFAADRDALTSVTATSLKADGSKEDDLTVTLSDPVAFGADPAVLTDGTEIPVTGTFTVGYTATVVLTFENAGQVTITAPIVDANTHEYQTVSPTPAPSVPVG